MAVAVLYAAMELWNEDQYEGDNKVSNSKSLQHSYTTISEKIMDSFYLEFSNWRDRSRY